MTKEGGLAAIALDEVNMCVRAREGDDQTGQPCPAAEVDPDRSFCERNQLQRIRDVAAPDLIERLAADEVLDLLPPDQLGNVALQLRSGFT